MTESELRQHYRTLFVFIQSERIWRSRVFPPGHPQREEKIAQCREALAAATALKDFCKAEICPVQDPLFELPVTPRKGGY